MKKFTLLFLLMAVGTFLSAQDQRYVDEIFTDVDVQENVFYGTNATVLAVAQLGEAVPQPLVSDVYTPMGDTETERPLVIIAHTGNFLPTAFNGGCGGTHKDADVVELAKRMARMGYVAVTIDYRLGWDPTNPSQTTRVFTIINAAYRGVQDSRTAVKYFRQDAESGDNQWGIDPSKIVLWGFGTGAYVTYGSATLNDISETYIPEFIASFDPFIPMIIEPINGDLNADNVGIAMNYPPFPDGDTLCYPNHTGVDASFNLAVQMGGALGDTSWISPGDVPMISYHVPTDPFAPCTEAVLSVPPPVNLPVVEVNGACLSIPTANSEGINDIFSMKDYIDPITAIANERSGGEEGLFLFPSDDPAESAPWNFSYSAEPYGVTGSDCDTDEAAAMAAMDTVMQYYIPRACITLDLGCDLSDFTNTTELEANEVGLVVAPNPAMNHINITTEKNMLHVIVYDMNGKVVKLYDGINNTSYDLFRDQIGAGMFVAQVFFEEGVVAQKFVFN